MAIIIIIIENIKTGWPTGNFTNRWSHSGERTVRAHMNEHSPTRKSFRNRRACAHACARDRKYAFVRLLAVTPITQQTRKATKFHSQRDRSFWRHVRRAICLFQNAVRVVEAATPWRGVASSLAAINVLTFATALHIVVPTVSPRVSPPILRRRGGLRERPQCWRSAQKKCEQVHAHWRASYLHDDND